MEKLTKVEKAKRLVELTGSGVARHEFDSSTPAEHIDLRRKLEDESRKLSVELRVKHYSEEQLDALLGFYESEMGKSIQLANQLIRKEHSQGYRSLGQNLAVKIDGGLRLEEFTEKTGISENRDDDR